jgi:hypothetical protein
MSERIENFVIKFLLFRRSQKKEARLYMHNRQDRFETMPYSSDLDQYDNQIIECSYRAGEWCFYRHRIDKTYANAEGISYL